MKLRHLFILNRCRSLTNNTLKSATRYLSSPTIRITNHTNPISTFTRKLHSVEHTPAATDSEEEDGTMTEFLSRFVWIMRGKLNHAYPGVNKDTINGMLLIIVEKIVEELEKDGGDGLRELMRGGLDTVSVSDDFSEELWKTVWEVSKNVLQDMDKARKKEEMKKYIQSDEVKEMCRFASEVGVRGNMLREFRFKWAKEKMEEAEFYQRLDEMRAQAHEEDEELSTEEEEEELSTEEEEVTEGEAEQTSESGKTSEEMAENGSYVETEVKPRVISLPQRRGKLKYKIYGLDLSDPKWAQVADNIHESEKLITPEEPKPITGRCKLVTEKILHLGEGDDPSALLAEWTELLKPSRVDWFALLDRLKEANAGLYLKVAELVLDEDSFQANIRDYSKLIDAHAKDNRMDDPIKRAKNGDTDYFKRTPVEVWGNVLDWGEGDTVFGHAIMNHHIHCSKAIYARCPELLHQQSKVHRYTVLHHAAFREETPSLLKFIISVADRELYRMPFIGAMSALHHCIYHCKLGSARLLIEVDPDHLSHIDRNGDIPLLYAIRFSYGKSVDHDSVKMRRLLLEKHPNASKIRTGEHGWTALHHSSSEGDVSALEDIIQFCPDSVHMVDNDGHSFLDIAIRYKQDEVVNYVLQSKELRACIPQGKLKQEIEKIALYFNFHHKKEVKEKKKKKKFLYKPSWMTKNMREMKLCIPSKYLHLYRKLVKEFGEIVLPNVPSTTLMENDPACLALGCFLGDVAEIVNSKPREVSQEQILEWEKMGKQYSALGLQVNWFQKLVAEYSNWFAKKTQNLVHLDDELATKTDKLNIKYAELQELETELEELHEQRDTYKAESDQTKFGLQVRLNTYIAWRIKLPLRIAKLPLRSRRRHMV